ncbi:hypothetical protein D3C71_2205000 [compost metagenome]
MSLLDDFTPTVRSVALWSKSAFHFSQLYWLITVLPWASTLWLSDSISTTGKLLTWDSARVRPIALAPSLLGLMPS